MIAWFFHQVFAGFHGHVDHGMSGKEGKIYAPLYGGSPFIRMALVHTIKTWIDWSIGTEENGWCEYIRGDFKTNTRPSQLYRSRQISLFAKLWVIKSIYCLKKCYVKGWSTRNDFGLISALWMKTFFFPLRTWSSVYKIISGHHSVWQYWLFDNCSRQFGSNGAVLVGKKGSHLTIRHASDYRTFSKKPSFSYSDRFSYVAIRPWKLLLSGLIL